MPPKLSGVSPQEASEARQILEEHIQQTWKNGNFGTNSWVLKPEIPTSEEILPPYKKKELKEESWNDYQEDPVYDPNLATNIIDGPWSSRKTYLRSHFEILREDAVASLRESCVKFRADPSMIDDKDTRVYTNVGLSLLQDDIADQAQVHITGVLLSRLGPAVRVEFSTNTDKQIRWQQSTRLLQGTIVALSPARDRFRTQCKVAIIAARPFEGGLDQNPPTVDLFWASVEEFDFNPFDEWVMVEARQGYFEASRHMLVGIQKLMTEMFPLSKHIVKVDKNIKAPKYVEEVPFLNLTPLEVPAGEGFVNTLIEVTEEADLHNVDVVNNFPESINSKMDDSQLRACKAMLTQRVAIIQGPPGTGKTFVSVAALRTLIANLNHNDPPIIVAAQTNHALDQLLNHVLEFKTNIVRLGGRSERENTEIRKRTLYELRQGNELTDTRQPLRQCRQDNQTLCNEIRGLLSPLIHGDIMSAQSLVDLGIITDAQKASLVGAGWSDDEDDDEEESNDQAAADESGDDLRQWLGHQIMPVPRTPATNLGLPSEEVDLEFEQLQNIQEELALRDDGESDALQGVWIAFGRKFTGQTTHSISPGRAIKKIRNAKDLSRVPEHERGELYRCFEVLVLADIQSKLTACLQRYKKNCEESQVTKGMANYKLIRFLGTKVIGCTTTGLAKYRALLAALQPRTLLIEEAAETKEGTITAGLVESIQQLILVGDHKQLQASCNVQALEDAPYNMKVSMFERLVMNHLPHVRLNKQRRMVPEIRKLLCLEDNPFYPDLTDHTHVLDRTFNRLSVPGMGGRNVYFHSHNWPEAVNSDASRYNSDESEMIAGFFHYLTLNGTDASKITVLTFYNGQRKAILKDLRSHPGLKNVLYFNVFTVDSYQGEENDIILLSLVRSNNKFQIGFVDNQNRAVVALSRARRGLYMFGNSVTLAAMESNGEIIGRDRLWGPIVDYMNGKGQLAIGMGLPITCRNHNKVIRISEPWEWDGRAGGCNARCRGVLPCGHPCILTCHPFEHSMVVCKEACHRILPCGHGCSGSCGEKCWCEGCRMSALTSFEAMSIAPETPTRKPISRASENDPASVGHSNTGFNRGRGRGTGRGRASDRGRGGRDFNVPRMEGHSNRGSFNPKASSFQPSPGNANAWQSWNARAADEHLAAKNRPELALAPSKDPAITETYVPVGFKPDGSRKKNLKDKTKTHFPSMDGADEREVPAENEVAKKGPANFGLWEKKEIVDVLAAPGLWQKSNPAYKDIRYSRGYVVERTGEPKVPTQVIDAGAFGIVPSISVRGVDGSEKQL
ncbi:related to NAM7-nonsense-mediated mRNA decay protein [Phialocephala subalpina]|uniref:Related to NAM7-nonsense-mediated mRNA decay protein n=1 Tax=Phialocephala subalpina TaxID=576137 RepID=A0A1L7XDJ8_9HELO|nr:related to NAM7-nonsense-mediated mRNA decay protein [Phialocephala subalpina]